MAFATPFSGSLDQKPEDRAFLSTIVTQCPANALVLDVGSGPQAQAARFLASPRRRVCCVDIDAAALRSAAMLLGPLADGVQADMSDLGRIFRSEMFDLVVGFLAARTRIDRVNTWGFVFRFLGSSSPGINQVFGILVPWLRSRKSKAFTPCNIIPILWRL